MPLPVPQVKRNPWGFLALALNIPVPGLGTMVAGGNHRHLGPWLVGFVQFALLIVAAILLEPARRLATALVLADIAWSVAWGVLILARSK